MPRLAVLAYSFATNVYFMLAVGVFVRRLDTLNRIWRWRLVIDLLLSLSLAAAPYLLWLWERLTH